MTITHELNIDKPLWIVNVPTGILFYSLGCGLKDFQNKKKIVYISFVIYMCVMLFYPSIVDFRSMQLLKGNFYLWLLASVAGIVLINICAKRLPKSNFLQFIGKHSMSFYVSHWILLELGLIIRNFIEIENKWLYCILLTLIVCIGCLVNVFYKKVIWNRE